MVQVRQRFKLLLDANIPTREHFPILNNRHDMKHLVCDLKQKQDMEDLKIYEFACSLGRLVVTFNRKDFEPIAIKSKRAGIISVSSNVPNEQIDKKITALLSRSKRSDLFGKFHHITLP